MPKDVKFWRYYIPCEPEDGFSGWAIVFMDSTGAFCSTGDYGDYCYKWSGAFGPPGTDFRAFFLQCDGDYIRRKIAPELEYDPEGTLKDAKAHIISLRREKELDAPSARHEWERLAMHENLRTQYNFYDWARGTRFDFAELSERRKPSAQVEAFIGRTLPRLKKVLQDELFPVASLPGQS